MNLSKKKVWIGLMILIIISLSIFYLSFQKQKSKFQEKISVYQDSLNDLRETIEINKHKNLGGLIAGVLSDIDKKDQQEEQLSLSDDLIKRIAALSYSLVPDKILAKEKRLDYELSPERAQLLLSLSHMKLDSVSFSKIMASTTFSASDLRNAMMQGLNLRGVILEKSDLSDADLQYSILANAKLEKSVFIRSKLNHSDLHNSHLVRADFSWAELNEADLNGAELSGAVVSSASIRNSDFRNAKMDFAFLSSSALNGTNLSYADLTGTDFKGANLEGAKLNHSILKLADFRGANLTNAILEKAKVDDQDWIARLVEWNVEGVEEIALNYIVRKDTNNSTLFVIEKREKSLN